MAFTKIVAAGINTGSSYTFQDLNAVGIVTAGTVQVGAATTIHTTGIDLGSGNITSRNINSTGIISATSFVGPVTGNITGDITATSGTFSGNVSIGGTLTYEDVTNIDSVGIITAQAGIRLDDSITHLGDTNTKIRFPAADTFTIETAGSEALRVTSTGNIGIGLNNPFGKLQVRPGTNANFSFTTGGGESSLELINDAGSANVPLNVRASEYKIKIQGNEKVRITSAGNIGIGTDTFTATSSGRQIVEIEGASGSLINFAVGGARKAYHFTDGTDVYSYNTVSGSYIFGTNNAERLRITSAGLVGINTTAAQITSSERLSVFQAVSVFRLDSATTGAVYIRNGNFTNANNPFIVLQDTFGNRGGIGIANNDSAMFIHGQNGVRFRYGGSSPGSTEAMRITSGGMVGINTTTGFDTSVGLAVRNGVSGSDHTMIDIIANTNETSRLVFSDDADHNQGRIQYNHTGNSLAFYTNGNNERLRIDSAGNMTKAPSGMMVRSGFYDTGTGSGARTAVSSTSWTTININGTNQKLHNITKFSDDGLAYNKVSGNSHLNITVNFPYYYDDSSATAGGFGIRGFFSLDDGSNYYTLSGLSQGPAHGWGAGGYGGTAAGVFTYTWNTRMNGTIPSSTVLAKTGNVRFYWEVRTWSGTSTVHMIDYLNSSYPKKGSIIIQEIVE